MAIAHWATDLWCSNCVSPLVCFLALAAASPALIRFNDWYTLGRAASRESSVEDLEALFALEDYRGIGRSRSGRKR